MPSRYFVAWEARRLRLRAERAERRERAALIRAGERLAGLCAEGILAHDDDARQAAALAARLSALGAELIGSLEQDRLDYAPASEWARPLIVARGVCERAVLRDQLRRARRARTAHCLALGTRACAADEFAAGLPAALIDEVRAARAEARRARDERERLLEPYAGVALPPWAAHARREGQRFGLFLVKELRVKLLPRLPVVAGLLAGWWVTRHYVSPDGVLESARFGALRWLGAEDRAEVSADTMARLRFWLPLFAAALCGWLSYFIAERVRRRYLRAPEPARAVATR